MPFGLGRKTPVAPDISLIDALEAALPPDQGALGPAIGWTEADTRALVGRDVPLFTYFLAQRARSSYGGGLLRFLLPDMRPSIKAWNGPGGWQSDWPSTPNASVFATDWKGRLYLFSRNKPFKDDEPRIARLDPATAEIEVYDATFGDFVGDALPRLWRTFLATDLLDSWKSGGGPVPATDQCVAPKISPFVGGSDDVPNLEISSLIVAVSIGGQIWEQVKDLPAGTKISGLRIS